KGLRGWRRKNKNKIREILQSGESVVQTKRKCLDHGLKGLRGWRGENENKKSVKSFNPANRWFRRKENVWITD
ncbi:MAG: hypothetical protein KF746_28345, partial [Chitinophagaceae bacterium]|nr:hypothetical protein [Chitinophagaceae bacterium]